MEKQHKSPELSCLCQRFHKYSHFQSQLFYHMQYWHSMDIFITNIIIICNEFSIWVWVTQNIWEKKASKWEAVGERGHGGGWIEWV